MHCQNMTQTRPLSDIRIMQIRAKATGSTVHPVYNLIGAYQMAARLMDQRPNETKWREMVHQTAAKLHVFFHTGMVAGAGYATDAA
jgi:hypothetical protein